MPRYPRVAVNFHTAADKFVFPVRPHDHRIAVYPAARLEVLAAFHAKQPGGTAKADEYAAELAGVRLKEAEAFAREYRYLEAIGAARDAVAAKDTPAARDRLRTLIETQQGLDVGFHAADRQAAARDVSGAIGTLEGVLKVKPTWAPARGKLGTLYAMAGDRAKAVEHLSAVARADPDDPYGYNMLGWLAYLDGKAADAADLFRRADELHPNTAEINYRWGLALLQLEKWPDAAARFRRATGVDPKHAGAFQGLGHALRRTGPADEAVRAARRAAQLTGYQNADVLLTLADAYAAADRPAEAVEAARRAVDAALVSAPGLVEPARRRLDELRARRH
jgi:tetratricopeptide (TPR) repeat protein